MQKPTFDASAETDFLHPHALDWAIGRNRQEMALDGFRVTWEGPLNAAFSEGWLWRAAVWQRGGELHWGYVSDGDCVTFGWVVDLEKAKKLAIEAGATNCGYG